MTLDCRKMKDCTPIKDFEVCDYCDTMRSIWSGTYYLKNEIEVWICDKCYSKFKKYQKIQEKG